jgi:hypothetical protein
MGDTGTGIQVVRFVTASSDVQLWGTDGTALGTALLQDFGTQIGVIDLGTNGNGELYFAVWNESTSDVQLWKTTGVASRTSLVQDFGESVVVTNFGANKNGKVLIDVVNYLTSDVQWWATT